jgi:hypothetical protein
VIVQADRGYDIGVACQLLSTPPPSYSLSLSSSIATNSNPAATGAEGEGEGVHEVTTTGDVDEPGAASQSSGHHKTIRKILSIITPDDKSMNHMLRNKAVSERQALVMAKTICSELKVGPSVEIVSVEFQADRKKLTVYYKKYADVSLCKLIRKLHTAFKMRIWMENIDPMVAAQENQDGEMSLSQFFQKLEERYFELASLDIHAEESSDILPDQHVSSNPTSSQNINMSPGALATSPSLNLSHQPYGMTVQSAPSYSPAGLPFLPRSGLAHPRTQPGSTASDYHTHLGGSHSLEYEYDGYGISNHTSDKYHQSQRHLNPRRRNQLPQRPPPPSGYADYLPRPPLASSSAASMYGSGSNTHLSSHYPMQRSAPYPQSHYQSPSHQQAPHILVRPAQHFRSAGGMSASGADLRDPYQLRYAREDAQHQQPRPYSTRSLEHRYGFDTERYHETNVNGPYSQSKMMYPSQYQYQSQQGLSNHSNQQQSYRGSRPSNADSSASFESYNSFAPESAGGGSFLYGDRNHDHDPLRTSSPASLYDQSLSPGFGHLSSGSSRLQKDSYGDSYLDQNSHYPLPETTAHSGLPGSRMFSQHSFVADDARGELYSWEENTGGYKLSQRISNSNSSSGLQSPDFYGADSSNLDDPMGFNRLHLDDLA